MAAFILEKNLSDTSRHLMTQVTMRKVSPSIFGTIPISNHKRYNMFSNPIYFHITNYHTNNLYYYSTPLSSTHTHFSPTNTPLYICCPFKYRYANCVSDSSLVSTSTFFWIVAAFFTAISISLSFFVLCTLPLTTPPRSHLP